MTQPRRFTLLPVLLSAALLSTSCAVLAQQPNAPNAPNEPAAPQPPAQAGPPPTSRGMGGSRRDMSRDMGRDARPGAPGQRGPGGPSDGGMHAGTRLGPPGMWWKNPDVITKLALTADQQKKMADLFQQSRIQLVHMKASLEEEEILLEPMLNANPPDSAKTLAQISKIADTRADLEKANAKMLLGIRGVLTPDQWTKLQADRRDHGMGFGDHKGPGGPGMHGN